MITFLTALMDALNGCDTAAREVAEVVLLPLVFRFLMDDRKAGGIVLVDSLGRHWVRGGFGVFVVSAVVVVDSLCFMMMSDGSFSSMVLYNEHAGGRARLPTSL